MDVGGQFRQDNQEEWQKLCAMTLVQDYHSSVHVWVRNIYKLPTTMHS